MANLKSALDYASHGWPVFPVQWIKSGKCSCGNPDCEHPGKHPIGKLAPNGRNSATTDPATIKTWWGQYPDANIGIATGKDSGLVVVDIDPRHGGDETKKRLERSGNFPYTVTAYTGGGGEHIFMAYPDNGQGVKSKNDWRPGIDIKADGGYIVAPPSNHISGESYLWKIGPDSTPVAKTPDWFMSLLMQDDTPKRQTGERIEGEIPEKKRNDTLTSLAGSMRQRGMTQEGIEAALMVENQRCTPPLSEKEVRDIAKSVAKYEPGEDKPEAKPTQAELLLKLAAEAELFHDLNRKGYATIPINGHLETWPIKSMAFRDWLRGLFYKAHGKPPGGQALQDSLETLAAQARFDGQEYEVNVRVAHAGGKIYVDLANDEWQAVEISPQDWRVVDRPPVKFRRPRGLAPLPLPETGGRLEDLKHFVNCHEGDWPLTVAWLVGAFSPGPYPALIFQGEQGTAKTTTARVLKSLVDPGHTPQRTAPRDIRDLMISAANSWCLSFDNLSDLRDWLSDGFCRLATGGGLSTRELYTNDDETILDAMRPVILNGIDSLVSRPDLGDRAILLEAPRIQDHDRQREADFWREFETAQPGILGAIFDCLAATLANVHKVKLAQLPRMADFATWIVAAEAALPWEPGTFLGAYARNRASVVEHSLEGDPVAVALRSFMESRYEWEGTPTELLNELTEAAGELVSRGKTWPKAANGLSNRLRRAATFLRASGVEVETGWGEKKGRKITIRKDVQKTVGTVGTVGNEENQGLTSHDTSHDNESSHDKTVGTVGGPWERKGSNHAASHDTHDTHDKIQDFSKTDEDEHQLGEFDL